jgi:hypothetical protein
MEDVAQARRAPTNRDMILSLLVIMIPLAVITVLLTRGPSETKVQTVDWKPVAAQASRQAPYQVLAPVELPAGWRATRVTWTKIDQPGPTGELSVRNRWQLGVLTDQDVYLELDQGDKQPREFVGDITRDATPDGTAQVAGRRWTRMITDDGRTRSLVNSAAKATTIVSGDTSYAQLATFVGLLQPAS